MKGRQLDTARMCRVNLNVDKDFGWDVTAMNAFTLIQLSPQPPLLLLRYWSDCKIMRVGAKVRSCQGCHMQNVSYEHGAT